MKTFYLISAVLMIGVLASLTSAAKIEENKDGSKTIRLSAKEHKKIVGRVVSVVANTVATVVNEHSTRSEESPKKGLPGTYPLNSPSPVQIKNSALGVARIMYYKEGPICSGIHLKPWIILTTAECVRNRDQRKMYVDVTTYNATTKAYERLPVEIQGITPNPLYQPDKPRHNLALMTLYGQFDWDVEEFHLPRNSPSPADVLKKQLLTFADEWYTNDDKTYYAEEVRRKITQDYTSCSELAKVDDWYCAERAKREKYNKVDVGSPLFYKTNKLKRLLGVFTGRNLDKTTKGHIYESVFPDIEWIEKYVHERPVPPFYY